MRIALVQQHATLDREDNVRRGLAALETAAGGGAELVCYAELAFEPFYPQRPAEGDPKGLAQEVPGPVTEAFAERAAALGVVVVLNLFERDGDECFDSSPVIDDDGTALVASSESKFIAIASDGTLKWSYDLGGGAYSHPCLDGLGSVYFGADTNYVY